MERDTEARFEDVERVMAGIVQVQDAVSTNLRSMAGLLEMHIRESIERDKQSYERMTKMEKNLDLLEKNLDLLIRAITAEHGNGKS